MGTWSKSTSVTRGRRHCISRRRAPDSRLAASQAVLSSWANTARASRRLKTVGSRSGGLGPDGVALDPGQRVSQADLVEEVPCAKSRVLGGGGHVLLDRQREPEGDDFGFGHLEGMPLAREPDKSLRPVDGGVLGADAVMRSPGDLADLVQQLGPVGNRLPEIPSKPGDLLQKSEILVGSLKTVGIIRKIGRDTIRPFRILIRVKPPSPVRGVASP
jgi:hypothetical protein